ncbi:Prophage integrase IntA [Rhodocyclaceae bacterium]|nr:Prophage integrase IntA [Rhodocyclaceae bacterium]
MAENKLTDKHLRNLKPADAEQTIGDGGGLWIRVLPAAKGGAINFYYRYTFNGKERRYNCGTYPDTSLSQARNRRNEARKLVKSGIDPTQHEETAKANRSAAQALERMEKTVEGLLDDWKRVYLSAHRKDGGAEVEAAMRRDVIPLLGKMRARDVKLAHVNQVIDRVLERGVRRTANVLLSLMRQMFRHGLGRSIVDTDPTLALSKKQAGGKETPVDRNLSFDEIAELSAKLAASDLHEKMRAAIWILLATGARIGELLKARWADINEREKTWTIPAENSKNGRPHLIHLSAFAMKQLKTMKEYKDGPFLLSGRDPDTGMSDKTVSKAIRDRIRKEPLKKRTPRSGTLLLAGGEWSPHDLRRTMASRMGDVGIEPHVIERCLNHVQQGIVGVYQRQEYMKERKAAFETWGRKLASLTKRK